MTSGKKWTKWLIAAAGLLGVFLAVLLVLPLLFKGRLDARARAEVGKAVAARVDWRGVGLTFFRDFPNLTLSVDGLTVVGTDHFAGDTLASVGSVRLVLDLGSVVQAWRGRGPVVVRSIRVDDPVLDLRVLPDGTANWSLLSQAAAKPASAGAAAGPAGAVAASAGATAGPAVALRSFELTGGDIAFRNDRAGLDVALSGLGCTLSGDFTQSQLTVRTHVHADHATVRFAGIPYLDDVALDFNATGDADMASKRFTFKDDELRLNELALRFAGQVTQGKDGLGLDVTFDTPQTGFAQALSLVPAIYAHDFASLQTSGTFGVKGSVHGTYAAGEVPAFSLAANVADATFRYPSLPLPARGIGVALTIDNPGGNVDSTVVRLQRFHAVIGDQPIDASLTVRTPVSDPYVDAHVQGTLDLSAVPRTIELKDVGEMTGVVKADVSVRARLSDVDSARYDRVAAQGTVDARNVHVRAASLGQPLDLREASLVLTPRRADLKAFDASVGGSDVEATGQLDNVLGFALHKEPLQGSATFRSRHFVLDDWKSSDSTLQVIPVPAALDLALSGTIDTLTYGALGMTDARGRMTVRDQRLTLDTFSLKTLGGRVGMKGYYETTNPARPTFDMGLSIDSMDIAAAARTMPTVRALAPVASYARGSFSTKLDLAGALGTNLMPVLDALDGKGSLSTSRVTLEGFPVLQKLADALKTPRLSSPTLDAIRSTVEIKDGRMQVHPFRVRVGNVGMSVQGSNGIDQSLDYTLGLVLPRSALGDAAKQVVQGLASRAGRVGLNLQAADSVRVGVKVTGTVKSPTLDIGLGEAVASAGQQVEKAVTGEAKAKVDSAEIQARRRAQAQADSMVAAAQRQADGVRADAKKLADQIRAEGNRQADAVLAKATNPIARAAAQRVADAMRKEADDKANALVRQADQRADSLVADARKKADRLGAGG
jgi:hypothetical protein